MKKEYTDSFVKSAKDVLGEIINSSVTLGITQSQKQTIRTSEVVVVVVLVGEVKGRILIDMSKDTAIRLSEIMNNEQILDFNDMVKETVIEIGNMIAGRAITIFRNITFSNIEMALPILFAGRDIDVMDTYTDAISAPIETKFGKININISLMEKS